ncbi:MAG TPA: hypothetical protein VF577_03880 [Allosphingosinicella sp.]|jgi:hypothetical protein
MTKRTFLPATALAAALLAAAAAPAAARPNALAAYDAWERCAVEAAVAAIPTNPDDDAVVRHAREACAAEGRAYVELWIEMRHARFPPDVVTREQRIAYGLDRHWRGHEILIRRMLPEARRTGATRVRMRVRYEGRRPRG